MSLHTSKVQNHNVSTSHFNTYPNSPCAHLFILIIFDPISHICVVHTQRKVYHPMPLHTYTLNLASSSNLQEIILSYRLHSNDPPFAHLFVLIMCEITTPICSTHHSNMLIHNVNSTNHAGGVSRRDALVLASRWGAAAAATHQCLQAGGAPPPRRT